MPTNLPPSLVLPRVFVGMPNEAGIRAARAAALAAGGGTVLLPDATITITSPLPCDTGIKYVGVQPRLTYSGSVTEKTWTFSGGTVLVGDGTFSAFSQNTASKGSPDANFLDDAISNFGIASVGFSNFTSAVAVGAHNAAGLIFSQLESLYIYNCTSFAMKIVNYHHLEARRIICNKNTHGPYFGCDVPVATLQTGNSRFDQIIVQANDNAPLSRGIVWEALNGSSLNEIVATRIQSISFSRTQISQAATMTNTSTTIAVTDGTKFSVGLPVSVSATANGFTAGQIYFVLSISTNNLTLGNSRSGAAIAATGGTATNVVSYGMPIVEICGDATSTVVNSNFYGIDAEGNSAASIYLENTGSITMDIGQITTASVNCNVVGRNAATTLIRSANGAISDLDATSATTQWFGNRGTTVQRSGTGMWKDSVLAMNGLTINGNSGNLFDLETRSPSGSFIYPNLGMGMKVSASSSTTLALVAGSCGYMSYNAGVTATWTLPTIVTDTTKNASHVGLYFELHNIGTSTLTVNTDGTQLFNRKAGSTSIALAANTRLICKACKDAGSNLYWSAYVVIDP